MPFHRCLPEFDSDAYGDSSRVICGRNSCDSMHKQHKYLACGRRSRLGGKLHQVRLPTPAVIEPIMCASALSSSTQSSIILDRAVLSIHTP